MGNTSSPRISWEGHFMGLIVGVILAIIYRKKALSDQNTFMKSKKNWVLNLLTAGDVIGKSEQGRRKKSRKNKELKIVYHLKKEDNKDSSEEK